MLQPHRLLPFPSSRVLQLPCPPELRGGFYPISEIPKFLCVCVCVRVCLCVQAEIQALFFTPNKSPAEAPNAYASIPKQPMLTLLCSRTGAL